MELGFVEKVVGSDESPLDTLFVSKVGGKPAWPDLKTLPADQICKKCGNPLVFLLQIHSPLSPCEQECAEGVEEDPRTLFLFMCREPRCHSPGDASCFQVLRYESRGLEFSDLISDPKPIPSLDTNMPSPSTDSNTKSTVPQCDSSAESQGVTNESHPWEDTPPSLCVVCGGRGTKTCGSCRKVNYCSKHHQIHDWKLGHKKNCTDSALSSRNLTYDPSSGVALPEWEVVTEPEPEGCGKQEERSEEDRMKDYRDYIRKKVKGGANWSEEGLGELVRKEKQDKVYRTFMKRIAAERQQVKMARV